MSAIHIPLTSMGSLAQCVHTLAMNGRHIRALIGLTVCAILPRRLYTPEEAIVLAEVAMRYGLLRIAYGYAGYAERYMHPAGDAFLLARALHLLSAEYLTIFPKGHVYRLSVEHIYRDLAKRVSAKSQLALAEAYRDSTRARVLLAAATYQCDVRIPRMDGQSAFFRKSRALEHASQMVRSAVELLAQESSEHCAFALQVYLSAKANTTMSTRPD